VTEVPPLVLSTPHAPSGALSGRVIAKALRDNAILAFPPEAFEEDVVYRSFFGRQQIILNRPAGIHHILVDNPDKYRRTPATMRILRPLLGNGLLLSQGEEWKHQRRTVAPAFALRTMPLLARHVARAAEATVAGLAAAAEREIDLLTAMQSLALEIAGTSMFSVAMELIGRIIAERRGKGSAEAPRDLFDMLSTARDPESGATFSAEGLVDQVATLIAAGHETTGVALFWSLWLVAAAPDVQERLAAEAETLDLAPDNAAETLPELAYTRAVVHEALRLFPPAFTIVRQARNPDNAGGISIPAGAIVFISPWVLHRHRRLWRQPEVFDPSRFLPGAAAPDRFAYLPFGVGPRVCVGAQFALTEATLVLATMIKAFRIERADDDPVMPVGIVTTQPDHPPLFLLQPRR